MKIIMIKLDANLFIPIFEAKNFWQSDNKKTFGELVIGTEILFNKDFAYNKEFIKAFKKAMTIEELYGIGIYIGVYNKDIYSNFGKLILTTKELLTLFQKFNENTLVVYFKNKNNAFINGRIRNFWQSKKSIK